MPAVPGTALLLGDSTALKVIDDYDRTRPLTWSVDGFAMLGCTTTQGRPIDVGSEFGVVQEDHCATWREEWAYWRDVIDPDVAVVMIGAWEVLDHLVDHVPHRFPGDEWFSIVRTAIDETLDIAGAGGRHVAVMALPCMQQDSASDFSALARNDAERVSTFNALLREAAATKPDVTVLDLPGLLCPEGIYTDTVDGQLVRYDGVHVTPAGADLVVRWLTEQLDAQYPAGDAPAPPTPTAE